MLFSLAFCFKYSTVHVEGTCGSHAFFFRPDLRIGVGFGRLPVIWFRFTYSAMALFSFEVKSLQTALFALPEGAGQFRR